MSFRGNIRNAVSNEHLIHEMDGDSRCVTVNYGTVFDFKSVEGYEPVRVVVDNGRCQIFFEKEGESEQ